MNDCVVCQPKNGQKTITLTQQGREGIMKSSEARVSDITVAVGLGLVRDTPTHQSEHVCLVTWDSYDAWLRGGPDKVQFYQTVLIFTFDL